MKTRKYIFEGLQIVKCKLGDRWMLASRDADGYYHRYANTQDFPLRCTKAEVIADIKQYAKKHGLDAATLLSLIQED